MNTNKSSTSPRLICRLVRSRHQDAPGDSGWAGRHLDACPDCAAHYAAAAALEQELRETAPSGGVELPGGLEDRIWAAVQVDQSSRRASQARPAKWIRPALGLGAAGVLAAIALVGWPHLSVNPEGPVIADGDFDERDIRILVEQIEDYSAEWLVRSEGAKETAPTNPLTEELNALEADASSAVRFLQKSFFPTRKSAS